MKYKVLEKCHDGKTKCLEIETNKEVLFSEHVLIEEQVGEIFELSPED